MTRPLVVQFGMNASAYCRFGEAYANAYGCDCAHEQRVTDMFKAAERLKAAAMVLIWNGMQACGPLARELCQRRGIPHAFWELGILGQQEAWQVDTQGFCGRSMLNGPLHWVATEDFDRLEQTRKELRRAFPRKNEGHVLLVGQIHNDTQVLYNSPYEHMDQLMADVCDLFEHDEIVVRHHPKSDARGRTPPRGRLENGGPIMEAIRKARLVVGISSTCLFEAAIYGVPVLALGDHPLRTHARTDHETVAAAALSLRIPRDQPNLLPATLERHGIWPTGKQPLTR